MLTGFGLAAQGALSIGDKKHLASETEEEESICRLTGQERGRRGRGEIGSDRWSRELEERLEEPGGAMEC